MTTPHSPDLLQLIDSCPSTNAAIPRDAPHGFALMAREQTAGRGQRGNSWEAAPGLNITLSLMLRPRALPAARQFDLSRAVALGVADLLVSLAIGGVAVKWPNDVYVGNDKICGILIENTLSGANIAASVAGIGLNVNQTEFLSPAPNPTSLAAITGRTFDCIELARRMIACITARLEMTPARNRSDYRAMLWRGSGVWTWRTPDGTRFEAAVADVLPSGHLILSSHPSRPFAFKEVFPC